MKEGPAPSKAVKHSINNHRNECISYHYSYRNQHISHQQWVEKAKPRSYQAAHAHAHVLSSRNLNTY